MKAEDFCAFFDFSLERGEWNKDVDGFEGNYKFRAVDSQGVFHDRYAEKAADLSELFDSMLMDYVEEPLEYRGFQYNEDRYDEHGNPITYYEQAAEWIPGTDYDGTDLHEVVRCLVNPRLLE